MLGVVDAECPLFVSSWTHGTVVRAGPDSAVAARSTTGMAGRSPGGPPRDHDEDASPRHRDTARSGVSHRFGPWPGRRLPAGRRQQAATFGAGRRPSHRDRLGAADCPSHYRRHGRDVGPSALHLAPSPARPAAGNDGRPSGHRPEELLGVLCAAHQRVHPESRRVRSAKPPGSGVRLRTDGRGHASPPRRVEPYHVLLWAGRWYLVCFDLAVQDWRILRIERIRPRTHPGPSFTPRPLPQDDIVAYVTHNPDRGDTPAHWQCLGSAVIDLPAPVVAQWAPGGSVVEPVDVNRCRLTLGGWSWAGVAGLYATFDADLSDVEPEQLRDAFADLLQRAREASASQIPRTPAAPLR